MFVITTHLNVGIVHSATLSYKAILSYKAMKYVFARSLLIDLTAIHTNFTKFS